MGTKDFPGMFDCYAELEKDEPHFVLRSTDEQAAWLVDIWASMRRGDICGAVLAFSGLVDTCGGLAERKPPNTEKVNEAENVAVAMRNWRLSRK